MKSLLFATQNNNKLIEVQASLEGMYTVKSLNDFGFKGELEEPYDTFEENAVTKARQGYEFFGLPCFAEDAGLVIGALGGKPGVLSARYGGSQKNAEANIDKVLTQLRQESDRRAYFTTVIAYFDGLHIRLFEGRIDGHILMERRGHSGFGYDPIFEAEGYQQSFGEMDLDIKKGISHRAIATRKFIAWLKDQS